MAAPIVAAVVSNIEENCQLTLQGHQAYLRDKYNLNVSTSTIANRLRGEMFTAKRPHPVPVDRNTDATKAMRKAYAERYISDMMGRNVVFIDETGLQLCSTGPYGWSRRGLPAFVKVPSLHSVQLNIIAAMSSEGVIHSKFECGSVNNILFQTFLEELVVLLPQGVPVFLVMDNCRIHKRLPLLPAHVKVVFLPPYSPMLNPIEMMFNQLKAVARPMMRQRMAETLTVNAHARGMTATNARYLVLMEVATASIAQIDVQSCGNYVLHTHKELPKAMALVDM